MAANTVPEMNGHLDGESHETKDSKHKCLVLCFDGTGNRFLGNESDTNIVKIYQMLDRTSPDQYHYYQRILCPTSFSLSY